MYGSWKIALVGFTVDFAIHGRYFIKCDSHVGFIRIVVKCNIILCVIFSHLLVTVREFVLSVESGHIECITVFMKSSRRTNSHLPNSCYRFPSAFCE